MSLSPVEVVGLICVVIGVNVGAVYVMEALPSSFGGPRRGLALAGVLAVFLIALTMNAAVMLQAGRQAANFTILGLLPALMLTRVATRAHPRSLQLGLLVLGLVAAYGIIAILLWGLGKGPQDDGTWLLFAVYAAIPLILGYLSLRRIFAAPSNTSPPTETGTPA